MLEREVVHPLETADVVVVELEEPSCASRACRAQAAIASARPSSRTRGRAVTAMFAPFVGPRRTLAAPSSLLKPPFAVCGARRKTRLASTVINCEVPAWADDGMQRPHPPISPRCRRICVGPKRAPFSGHMSTGRRRSSEAAACSISGPCIATPSPRCSKTSPIRQEAARIHREAWAFFAETVAPVEMCLRGYQQSNDVAARAGGDARRAGQGADSRPRREPRGAEAGRPGPEAAPRAAHVGAGGRAPPDRRRHPRRFHPGHHGGLPPRRAHPPGARRRSARRDAREARRGAPGLDRSAAAHDLRAAAGDARHGGPGRHHPGASRPVDAPDRTRPTRSPTGSARSRSRWRAQRSTGSRPRRSRTSASTRGRGTSASTWRTRRADTCCASPTTASASAADARSRPNEHFGVSMMTERASMAGGWCRVESNEPEPGTTVVAWTPASRGEQETVVEGAPAEHERGARDAADSRPDR